jgi:predicted SprT family Zn-dependent metalloprotease
MSDTRVHTEMTSLRCDCQEWSGDPQLLREIEAGFMFVCPKCSQAITVREALPDEKNLTSGDQT